MTRKVYQSIHYQTLDTYAMVNGAETLIQFRGGTLQPQINGKYSTSNPSVIAAMDAGLVEGAAYKCISVETTPDEPELTSKPGFKADALNVKDSQDENGFTEVPGITTIQAAKEYLVANVEGLTLSRLPNGNTIKSVAAANRIKFTDLV